MNTFQNLLNDMVKRPALYVGTGSIRAVSDYLSGYDHAMIDNGMCDPENSPLCGWMRWVELRFLISSPAWHWTRILLHVYGSDREALDALPALYEQFLELRASIGSQGIEAEWKQRFMAEYGEDWHVPEVTTTHDP